MKRYILNCYNLIIKRHICTKKEADYNIFYFVDTSGNGKPCEDVKLGEPFYAFVDWKLPQTNVFSEKDCMLAGSIKKQTNNPLVYLWWLFRYRKENFRTRYRCVKHGRRGRR